MLALGTVAATYGIARRLTNVKVAWLAGLILSTSLMFDVAARAATPDSLLIFCGTMALWIYVAGTFSMPRSPDDTVTLKVAEKWFPQNGLAVVGLYACLALGVLAKGPVGFLLPMAVLGLFILTQTHRPPIVPQEPKWRHWCNAVGKMFSPSLFIKTVWSMRPLTAVAVVLLIAAPWYALVDQQTEGDFTRLFFWGEHFGRATTAFEGHRGGLWFYPLAILIGFFPWSIWWGPVTLSLFSQRTERGSQHIVDVLALCWIGVQVGAFSVAQTKLASYVTPCYPALAILTARHLVNWADHRTSISEVWSMLATTGLSLGGLLTMIGLGLAAQLYFDQQYTLALIGLIPLLGGIWASYQIRRGQRPAALKTLVLTACLFCFCLFGIGTVAIDRYQHSAAVLQPIARSSPEQLVASYRSLESSWIYYGGKPIYECLAGTDETSPGTLTKQHWWQPKPRLTASELASIDPRVVFLTTDEHVEELQLQLPPAFQVHETTDYFLKNRKIVVLKQTAGGPAQHQANRNSLIR